MRHVIIGTAGHIDHGKSALILALTGTDPDRWEEEKRRGITIDLGFAHLDLGDDLRAGFIDVPGHERFVKNMLAGVGGIDLVMLIVAADESIKPQTREHFDICRLLGIRRGLVVITKSDVVDQPALDLVRLELQDFTSSSFLEGAPIVPVSARTGAGLDGLRHELHKLSLQVPARSIQLPFRLPIDRSFAIKGFGTVATGTLIAGSIAKDAEVEIYPAGKRVRVRGIEVYNERAERAIAGQRTALNLAGIDAREITRGMTLGPPGFFAPATSLGCALTLLRGTRALKSRAPVHFHCGTSEMVATVILLEGKELSAGATAYVHLRLSQLGLFLPGDRFIIRQFSPVITIGGGVILDSAPPRPKAGDPAATEALRVLDNGTAEARIELLVERKGETTARDLAASVGWMPQDVLELARSLAGKKRIVLVGNPPSLIVHALHFSRLAEVLLEQVKSMHDANSLVTGFPKDDLRGKLTARKRKSLPSPALFNALLQYLAGLGKITLQGDTVQLQGRSVQLTREEVAARDQIAAAFEKSGLMVPSAQEVLATLRLDRSRSEKILKLLVKDQVLLKITEGLIFHQSAIKRLREILSRHKARSNRITVPEFKQLTGVSRKYAIPLLEYLDRERVTRREGDTRIIL